MQCRGKKVPGAASERIPGAPGTQAGSESGVQTDLESGLETGGTINHTIHYLELTVMDERNHECSGCDSWHEFYKQGKLLFFGEKVIPEEEDMETTRGTVPVDEQEQRRGSPAGGGACRRCDREWWRR